MSRRRSFAKSVYSTKKYNSNMRGKIALRQWVVAAMGGNSNARVLDLCAGHGHMAQACYADVASYAGCDKYYDWDAPGPRWVCDSRLLMRCIDVFPDFNIIDIDTYGSPWPLAYLIASRNVIAPASEVAFVLTDGSAFKGKINRIEAHLAHMAGVRQQIRGASRIWPDITAAAMRRAAAMMAADVTAIKVAPYQDGRILYSAAILRGNAL